MWQFINIARYSIVLEIIKYQKKAFFFVIGARLKLKKNVNKKFIPNTQSDIKTESTNAFKLKLTEFLRSLRFKQTYTTYLMTHFMPHDV